MRTVIGMSLLLFVFACESDTKVGEGEKNITAVPLSYSWSLVEQTEFIAATTFSRLKPDTQYTFGSLGFHTTAEYTNHCYTVFDLLVDDPSLDSNIVLTAGYWQDTIWEHETAPMVAITSELKGQLKSLTLLEKKTLRHTSVNLDELINSLESIDGRDKLFYTDIGFNAETGSLVIAISLDYDDDLHYGGPPEHYAESYEFFNKQQEAPEIPIGYLVISFVEH
jgi:hypothetical protein